MRSRGRSILLLSILLLAGCQWLPEVSGVRLSESSVTLKVGGSKQLTAIVEPAAAEYDEITWTSSDPSVVSVANGQLSARKLGTATITASTEGVTSSPCTVTVEATKVTGVTINKYSLELTEGESASLIATVRPSNATDPSVSWSSSDRNVATVSGGHVSAVSAGKASITARTNDGGYTAICEVTVKAKFIPVSGVTISSSTLSLKPGETSQLTATVAPSNATNKDVSWSSSNTSITTVASDGAVAAIAPGTATITVTTADQGKTATCLVTVNAIPVSKITLSNTSLTLTEGDSSQLTATVAPSNATNKTVSWSSSDTSVAVVADDGSVTAKSAGTATITCSSANGAVKATCPVTVKAKVYPVTGVSLDRTSLTLTEGESSQLVATVSPSNATDKSVGWSSSNSSVAFVTSDGIVTAKGAGSATITCTTEDGAKKATCSVTVKNATVSVSSVSLDRTSLGLVGGTTGALKATVNPSNATNQGVTWSSNNTSVATVSSSGVVTAKAAGSATITVRTDDGGKTATCTVTVSNAIVAVTGVSVSPTSLSLTAGETYRLTPTVSPSNATNTAVSWSSSNTSVASVASDGTVTAKAAGSATITCTTQDGSMKATCSVTVTAPGPTLSFIPQKVINGMKGFEAVSYVYQPLKPSFIDDKNESWVRHREIYSECVPVVLTYNVSPSSFSFDNSFLYSFSYLDVSTRAYSSEDFTITPHFNSYYDGRLEVVAEIIGKEAYDGHMTTFALEVAKNRVTYTSDYAAVSTISMIPFISGLPSSIGSVWTSEIDRSSSDIVLDYTEGIDLRTKTVISVADVSNSSKVRNMTASEMEDAGLSVVYEVVKNYKVGLPAEDQGIYADLSGSELWPCHYGNIPTGGRTPIVRVKLMHNEDVIDVAYHKVYINFPTSVSVTGVSFDQTSLSLEEGKTATLTATVSPSNATNKAVTWSSSNTSVATVSTSGVVTAKSAGSATITCTTEDGAKKATCAVTVSAAEVSVTGVSLDKTSLSLEEGKTATLTATVSPSDATNKAVTWSSSNTSVATVSTSGVVTAKAAGSATITVTTSNEGKTAACSVSVSEASTPIEFEAISVSDISFSHVMACCPIASYGQNTVIEQGVCYSTSSSPTISNGLVLAENNEAMLGLVIDGLSQGTKYYVKSFVKTSSGVSYSNQTSFTTLSAPNYVIPGLFSVSSTKKVYIASGNLMYKNSDKKYHIFDNQYDILGKIASDGTFDLTSWAGFVGFSDIAEKTSGTWRLMTTQETYYLINDRSNASNLKKTIVINNVTGLMLLPDDWVCPSSIIMPDNNDKVSLEIWSVLQKSGAVFLPCAGIYNSTYKTVMNVGTKGVYSTYSKTSNSYYKYTIPEGKGGLYNDGIGSARPVLDY